MANNTNQLQSEEDLIAFVEAWDQKDVTAIPGVIIEHFPEMLELEQFAKSVPAALRSIAWDKEEQTSVTNSLKTEQDGFQLMAVDRSGLSLVRHIKVWGYEDVEQSTYSTMPLIEAQGIHLSKQGAALLILDRAGRTLVEVSDGFEFTQLSIDLRGAVAFDQAGAEATISRLQAFGSIDGPFTTQTVRDYKMAIIDSFGTTPENSRDHSDTPRM